MHNGNLAAKILENFPHQATSEQLQVVHLWEDFLLSRDSDRIFVLKGYAGTGKTSLIAALVKTWTVLQQRVALLAPTGRAAKVMSDYSGLPAFTIHKFIYRRKSFGDDEHFTAMPNLVPGTLFLVDEASMIQNCGLSGGLFGEGRLLDDLIRFVYTGRDCRLILIGDEAQLPPVGEAESPALNADNMESYGFPVTEFTLRQVVRQTEASGILWNATMLRTLLTEGDVSDFPRLRLQGFADIAAVNGNELLEAMEDSYYRVGEDETIVVTRSNKRAALFNQGIRARILDYAEELCSGDRIMIVKNNYRWMPAPTAKEDQISSFLANGDMAVVRRYSHERELYGLRFADAVIELPDYNRMEINATIMMDTLQSESPALPAGQQKALWDAVWNDYDDIPGKKERMEKMKQDVHLNALQIKYAYAVTCHKAQGGQWAHVYIDQGYVSEDMLSEDYFRWLYTALTRATEKVFLVNWPRHQQETTEEDE